MKFEPWKDDHIVLPDRHPMPITHQYFPFWITDQDLEAAITANQIIRRLCADNQQKAQG